MARRVAGAVHGCNGGAGRHCLVSRLYLALKKTAVDGCSAITSARVRRHTSKSGQSFVLRPRAGERARCTRAHATRACPPLPRLLAHKVQKHRLLTAELLRLPRVAPESAGRRPDREPREARARAQSGSAAAPLVQPPPLAPQRQREHELVRPHVQLVRPVPAHPPHVRAQPVQQLRVGPQQVAAAADAVLLDRVVHDARVQPPPVPVRLVRRRHGGHDAGGRREREDGVRVGHAHHVRVQH